MAVGLGLWASPASAQDAASELGGTLKRVKEKGAVTLGYRESSIPFSYVNKAGEPVGYSIDLCNEIVEEISQELGGVELGVAYKKVTAETRIAAVKAGEIDLECGSTTSNFERKKDVSFSPVFFVAGTKLLVRRGSGIESYRDLKDKTVVVTAGTTNAVAIKAISAKQKLDIKIVEAADHAASFDMLGAGKADAFATDDVLLYGLVATTHSADRFIIVGDYLSYEPYGLMYRKDDADLGAVVDRAFSRLAASRELVQLYNKWFQKRLPTGERLDLPISPELEEIFRVQGVPD
ncbi:MAG TPA: amino acid ABC transporter substrate-binding protein [Stellaceae bacterium]|jgi:glutamate/aspartate transport system substrate-binding protein|nr:amino acid ABC transporter substrate-binding protein [Stellaceae bacterium]